MPPLAADTNSGGKKLMASTMWSSAYETGNEMVDNDHKRFFSLVEDVLSSSFTTRRDKISTAMDFLMDYAVHHFKNEERLMEECHFPHTKRHKTQHSEFLASVTELIKRFQNSGYALGELQETSEDVMHFSLDINKTIVSWLTTHVMSSDLALANYYRMWSITEQSKQKIL